MPMILYLEHIDKTDYDPKSRQKEQRKSRGIIWREDQLPVN